MPGLVILLMRTIGKPHKLQDGQRQVIEDVYPRSESRVRRSQWPLKVINEEKTGKQVY